MTSNQELTVRQTLDKCWEFLDNLGSPENKYLVCTSANSIDDVEVSVIYYCRHNDVIYFPVDKDKWRQFDNVEKGRVFTFLIANTEVLSEDPQPENPKDSEPKGFTKYSRLTIQGKIDCYPQGSKEYDQLWSEYERQTPYDCKTGLLSVKNENSAFYMGIVKPKKIDYSIRYVGSECLKEKIKAQLELKSEQFDNNGNLIV